MTFPQTHKIGNNDINANFVFPHICSSVLNLDRVILVNVKLDRNRFNRIKFYTCRLHRFLLILNATMKKKIRKHSSRTCTAPRGPNSFNFMQFLGNFGKIVCWRPPPPCGVGAPSSEKSWIRHWLSFQHDYDTNRGYQ